MRPAPFRYLAPRSLDEALEALRRHGDDAKVLAGGQSLVPMMNMRLARPGVVIDINRTASLDAIAADDGGLRLGALVRQRRLELDRLVAARAPLLAEAAPHIGHVQTRARGTVGGSLAHADPAAELPACALALDATFTLASAAGTRRVAARDFYVGLLTTALAADELLVEVTVPPMPAGTGSAFVEVARRPGDFALVGAAAVVTLDSAGTCRRASLVFLGAGGGPHAARAVESLVGCRPDPALLEEATRAAAEELDPPSDVHASARYRRRVATALGARALAVARERAA